MATTKRVSMTLPISLIEDLDFLSRHLQVTRSSLVSEILAPSVSEFRSFFEQIISATPDDSASLARNPEKVRSYIESLNTAINDYKSTYDKESASLLHSLEGLKNEH